MRSKIQPSNIKNNCIIVESGFSDDSCATFSCGHLSAAEKKCSSVQSAFR